ncbi:MAG: hypothetical protein ACT6RF_17695 [Allorhizobium sp.]|uniref:hypothetical protein n=1 Tax=Allorhizobium sp. TaxID=633478 RepID=UPI0040345AF2
MSGGARDKTALEGTGRRLGEMLRQALVYRRARRMDGLSTGAAAGETAARLGAGSHSTDEQGEPT